MPPCPDQVRTDRTARFAHTASMALAATLAACGMPDVHVEAGRAQVEAGDVMTFRIEARAQELDRVLLEYGDGLVDTALARGARRITGRFLHTYQLPGRYEVRAVATQASGLAASSALRIRVLPRDPRR
ncbi:MAG TPA: PKD domain-containing protein [Gemmatimonadaceae bacterium]|nr:PKD domain-containing protein [Gemmatimonadaceae bacterium]